ncbi:hypothetical protein T310_4106 [Rasamsonia emersonii CBS 393.64]|uniref:Uncharacterized protein n=1 Tax=Rasamsonia emersonii (strain ATCC 16479 / CBS 393.64 / IMI 116815) TaxID=1408163 RepID=A0A0F4YW34_RASE3|nr:hypothetical protein T310_4106 [Rasamsonia emersonii CBS 393.64]KKA21833.1 hypothetical protein T310_4106 [Rasamsonia emersonii CBS 393.64]
MQNSYEPSLHSSSEIWGYNAYTACSLQEVDYYLRSALQNRISLANENRAQLIHNNSTLMTRIECQNHGPLTPHRATLPTSVEKRQRLGDS